MTMQFFNKNRKITDALEGLAASAREKKSALGETWAKGRAGKAVKAAGKEIHANPWMYIGAAAVAGLLFGFFAGRASKKESWER